jgi:hypothetical protein
MMDENKVVGCDCSDKSQCWEPCGDLGNSEEHAVPVDWDLNRMMKAVNSPSVRVPDNIKSLGGFREWLKSQKDDYSI